MGLFDTVECDYPLPDPRLQGESFQTKDLECLLESYTITADGRLIRQARSGGGAAALDRDVEWPIHGDLLIYTRDPDRERGLVELVVRFTHGVVESIRLLEPGHEARGTHPLRSWKIDPTPRPEQQEHDDASGARAGEGRLIESLRRDRAELEALLGPHGYAALLAFYGLR